MTKDNEQWGNIELPGLSDEELFSKNWNRVAGFKERSKNKKWLESMKKLAENRKNDPQWREKMKQLNANRALDPAWIESLHEGINSRGEEWLEKLRIGVENRKDYDINTDRWNDEKFRQRHLDSIKQRDPNWSSKNKKAIENKNKPIQTPDGRFDNRKKAAEFYKVKPAAISYRIKTRPKEYFYVD